MNTIQLRWWFLFNLIIFGLATLWYKGAFIFAWHADATKLSFITWSIFLVLSLFIGYLTMNIDNENRSRAQDMRYINACWFGAEMLMGLGLIGTVLGIIMMFATSSGGLDPTNVAAMKSAILNMSVGLTTAFVTTLSGIATSLLTKLQLISYEVNLDDSK